jgi:hypothetical protein
MPDDALKFDFQEGGVEGVISLGLDMERGGEYESWFDPSGEEEVSPVGCRRIAIMVEGECDEAVGEREFLQVARRVAGKYLNRMLAYLRNRLLHHWLEPVPMGEWGEDYFLYQTDAKWLEGDEETEVYGGRALLLPDVRGDVPFDDRALPLQRSRREELWGFIQEAREGAPERELVGSAKQHFVAGEYRLAAVEAVSALELGLGGFVGDRMRERQCYGRFKEVRDRLGVMAYLKALLPVAATEEQFESCRPIIGACVNLVAVRNRVAHRGVQPSGDDIGDIRRGIVAVEQLLDVVASHEGGASGRGST